MKKQDDSIGLTHIPIMLDEIIKVFEGLEQFENYFDATFGRGGHARVIMNRFPGVKVLALDRDKEAIEFGLKQVEFKSVHFVHDDFSFFKKMKDPQKNIDIQPFDGALIDLGVSSPQLDDSERGFSFYHSGPLDMRMDQMKDLNASKIVNLYNRDELIEVFKAIVEDEFYLTQVVNAILEQREKKIFETTIELSDLIVKIIGWRKKGHHPATKYFLALRMYINQELTQIQDNLPFLMEKLKSKGRLCVLTFHSMEDRIIKNLFKKSVLGKPLRSRIIRPKWNEIKKNPRARSAQLRIFERY